MSTNLSFLPAETVYICINTMLMLATKMTSKGEVSSVLLWCMRRLITVWVVVYVDVDEHSTNRKGVRVGNNKRKARQLNYAEKESNFFASKCSHGGNETKSTDKLKGSYFNEKRVKAKTRSWVNWFSELQY